MARSAPAWLLPFLGTGIVLAPLPAHAEAPSGSPRAIAIAPALAYALAHQPRIRSALAELAARRSEARIPRAAWLPQVGATAQLFIGTSNNTTAQYLGVPEVDLPRIGATKSSSTGAWSPSPSTLLAISLDQELFDFGRISAQIAVADALTQVARASADTIQLEVQLGVEEAFHAVLSAHEVVTATEEAYRRAVTHRDFASAGVRSGLRPPIDLTRAQADVAGLEVRRIRAATGLEAGQAALAAAMGADVLAVDALPIGSDESPAPAFAEALRLAGERNPIVTAALARVRAQKAATSAITRELLPNLFGSAGLSGRAGGAAPSSGGLPAGGGWLPDVANWHLAAILQWNLFDATILARRSAAQAREQVAQADLELVRMDVTLEAQRAWLDLDAAARTLPGLAQAVDAAKANQAQAEARFKAGIGTIVELADAEGLLTNAQLEQAIGRFALARARAVLGRVMADQHLPPSGARKGP